MTDDRRQSIPRTLARAVKDEAGWRCAIPTCRATSALQIAHIVPWSQVPEHAFDNLILLCAICHNRYDRGEIDRASIKTYKANLAIINHRYSDFEQRILYTLHDADGQAIRLETSAVLRINLMNLLSDGMITLREESSGVQVNGVDIGAFTHIKLAASGDDLVTRWFTAEPVADIDDDGEDDGNETDTGGASRD